MMLVDDHPVVRRGVRDILAEAFPTSAIAEVSSGEEAVSRVRTQRWDLVVLDLTLPDGSGLDVLKRVRQIEEQLPVLILSMHGAEQFGRRAIAGGASGYLTKETADLELVTAVTRIIRGSTYFGREILEEAAFGIRPGRERPDQRLSGREYEVFRMLVRGQTVKLIGAELGLSAKTISTYRRRILAKMQMTSNAELHRYAVLHSLIS
jgi:DNA-binding NarL/FixJ family response regulator